MSADGLRRAGLPVLAAWSIACGATSYDDGHDPAAGSNSTGGPGGATGQTAEVAGTAGGGAPAAAGGAPGAAGSSGAESESPGGRSGSSPFGSLPICEPQEPSETTFVYFAPPGPEPFQGTVLALAEESMEIQTDDGVALFSWRGPSLLTRFEAGEQVSVSFFQAFGGLSPGSWTIVRSTTSTAATLGGTYYTLVPTDSGAKIDMPTPAGFPSLAYVTESCCRAEGLTYSGFGCTYAGLEVAQGDMSSLNAIPSTENFGEWAITPLHASGGGGVEYTFNLSITLLGPATEAPAP